ncbi:kinetochore-associated protein KNL-2 homolog [Macadamia integrifolia]|uniref:kinetochore-associated protein KNL-2 homolog n=1 Tax=Macadamia integrifolia TaxID=60698 RepID=UPI001C52EBEE|nr:kinetochore-associated protein KNL-2 homolog [Macadamia integrifolia]
MAAAFPSASDPDISKNTTTSSFSKTVYLVDWWLIKTEKDLCGKRLAVGGITSKGQQAVRVFSSSPIFKRHDAFTLETADGISVLVKGLINRDRTLQNGFPPEVCSHFLFGFPYDWEAYSGECFHRESSITSVLLTSPVYGEWKGDVTNNEEISNSGNCNCEAVEDEAPSVPTGSHVKNISPSKVNVLVQLGSSANFPAISSRKLRVSNGKGKHSRKINDEDGSKGKGEVINKDLDEEALSGANISGFARGGLKGTAEQSLFATPNVVLSKISERSSLNPMAITGLKMNGSSPSDVKQNKYPDRRVSDRLKNLKSNKKENSGSLFCVTNEDKKPNSMLETLENPTGEKLAAGKSEPTKIPSGRKTNSSKGISHHSGTRKSSYGQRIWINKFDNDQATDHCLETETDEVNPVSVDSVLVNNSTKATSHKSKGKSALDLPDVGLKEIKVEEVDSMYQQHGTQLDNMSFPSPESVKLEYPRVADKGNAETTNQNEDKKPDCVKGTACGGAESTNQNEDFCPCIMTGDVKPANSLKVSAGARERSSEELSTSGKKPKRKLVDNPHACTTRYRMEKCSIVSPESLSSRRSKLGRLLLPPLAFWNNQQVVYDADGHITGIQNGLPTGESSAGSKSGAMKRKKKLK